MERCGNSRCQPGLLLPLAPTASSQGSHPGSFSTRRSSWAARAAWLCSANTRPGICAWTSQSLRRRTDGKPPNRRSANVRTSSLLLGCFVEQLYSCFYIMACIRHIPHVRRRGTHQRCYRNAQAEFLATGRIHLGTSLWNHYSCYTSPFHALETPMVSHESALPPCEHIATEAVA